MLELEHVEPDALSVACPKCGAAVDVRCVSESGRELSYAFTHRKRCRRAHEAWFAHRFREDADNLRALHPSTSLDEVSDGAERADDERNEHDDE